MKIDTNQRVLILDDVDAEWFATLVAAYILANNSPHATGQDIEANAGLYRPRIPGAAAAIRRWIFNNLRIGYDNLEVRYPGYCLKSLLANAVLRRYGVESAADALDRLLSRLVDILLPGQRTKLLNAALPDLVTLINELIRGNDAQEMGITLGLIGRLEFTLYEGKDRGFFVAQF